MAIKAGQILHVMNQFVVDRIQTGGPGQLTIPQEKVYELGNFRSVGIVRDIPDLTFSLECLETDTEVEALLTGSMDPSADVLGDRDLSSPANAAGKKYELANYKPLDIISPWKSGLGQFQAVHGIVVPYLFLESASYRYGLQENAGETFSLRGDSIYYVPGAPWQDVVLGSDLTDGEHTFEHGPALLYVEGGKSRRALSVTVNGQRLVLGTDYTETTTAVTLLEEPADDDVISITYGAATGVAATYPQSGATPFGTGTGHLTHQGTAVKPSAIRGKDIDVFFSTAIPGVDQGNGVGVAREYRWPDVQSATLEFQQTLEEDREFGNAFAIGRDSTDVPTVNGTVEIKPRSVEAWFTRLRQITGISDLSRIMGPQSSITGALRIEIRNPESGGSSAHAAGKVLKTHYVPAARFTMPGYSGQVQQKVSATLNWESDDSVHEIYKGTR